MRMASPLRNHRNDNKACNIMYAHVKLIEAWEEMAKGMSMRQICKLFNRQKVSHGAKGINE